MSYRWKHSQHTETRDASPVSWKRLRKRYPWLKQLKPLQEKSAKVASSTNGFAILSSQRTGKTWVTGAVIRASDDQDVLLVGPLTNLESTWEKFFREKMEDFTVCRSLPQYLEHKKAWKKAWGDTPNHCVLLLNYEAVTPILAKLRRIKWDRIVYDEAQRLKNRTSRSSRDAALLSGSALRRLALTGTPMDLSEKDLWAIMRFVNPQVFGSSWKDFEEDYLVKPKIDLKKKMGMLQRQRMILANAIAKRKAPLHEKGKKRFAKKIAKHMMRVSKEDMGMKPAKLHIVQIDLEPKQERKYRKLEKNMVVRHKGQIIKTPLKIVQMGKLQQITGGHLKDEDGETHPIGKAKELALRKWIDKKAGDQPFVVFCKFVWEVHMIERMLKRMGFSRVAKLWGKVKDLKKDKKRTNMLLGFQRGEFEAMVCQQRTGGVGVDLYYARVAFVYSLGHSFIDFDQMMSRLDFLDQKQRADFYLLAARLTIDMDIVIGVKDKKSITEIFYDRVNSMRDHHHG